MKSKYYAIIGYGIKEIMGTCTDIHDVLREEPDARFTPITKEQFEDDDFLDNPPSIDELPGPFFRGILIETAKLEKIKKEDI